MNKRPKGGRGIKNKDRRKTAMDRREKKGKKNVKRKGGGGE